MTIVSVSVWLLFLFLFQFKPIQSFAAAGGGGFGSPTTKNTKRSQKKPRRTDWADLNTIQPVDVVDSEPLDKWGLPPPTLEDIFPPLPAGTEIRSSNQNYTLTEIQTCLEDFIDLQLNQSFNEQGIEIQCSQQQQLSMKLTLLHESPPIVSIENFLSAEECHEIIQTVVNTSNSVRVDSPTFPGALSQRTSTSWFASYAAVPTFVAKAQYRLHVPLQQMEEPQVVRYQPGQLFSWHYDQVTPAALQNGGQRLLTVLVYLNTVPTGGGTVFRDLRDSQQQPLTIQPVQGTAVLFFPAFRDGRPDDRTLHQGQAVADGTEKWILQMWVHENDYRASLPTGNVQANAVAAVEQVARDLGYVP